MDAYLGGERNGGKAGTEIDAFKWLNAMLGNLKTAQSAHVSCIQIQ
jgi:hypothetical protein